MTDGSLVSFNRGQMLFQTGRYAEAEKEFRAALSVDPEFAHAHAMLALVLNAQKKVYPANEEARSAVAIEPDEAFYHYVQSRCFVGINNYKAAQHAIEHAISLAPYCADYYCFLAAIQLDRNERHAARQTLMQSLQIDPQHEQSLTILARIESVLGNTAAAVELSKNAVQNSPESSDAHTAHGYSFVYSGYPKEAFQSFREALRLDPNNESARAGLIEALKSHYFFYRIMFQFFAFMGRFSGKTQWLFIIGLFVGVNMLSQIAKINPAVAPILMPIVIVFLIFCLFSWIVTPLMYAFLWFSRWGRLAMTLKEKSTGATFVSMLGAGIAGLVTGLVVPSMGLLAYFGGGILLMLLPTIHAISTEIPKNQLIFGAYTAMMAMILLAGFVIHNLKLLGILVLMLIMFQFIANYINIQNHTTRDSNRVL